MQLTIKENVFTEFELHSDKVKEEGQDKTKFFVILRNQPALFQLFESLSIEEILDLTFIGNDEVTEIFTSLKVIFLTYDFNATLLRIHFES